MKLISRLNCIHCTQELSRRNAELCRVWTRSNAHESWKIMKCVQDLVFGIHTCTNSGNTTQLEAVIEFILSSLSARHCPDSFSDSSMGIPFWFYIYVSMHGAGYVMCDAASELTVINNPPFPPYYWKSSFSRMSHPRVVCVNSFQNIDCSFVAPSYISAVCNRLSKHL